MNCLEYLDKSHAHYKTTEHVVPFTSQQATSEKSDVAGVEVAVAEPVRIDDDIFLFVYPEDHAIDFDVLRTQFGADRVETASKDELPELPEKSGSEYAPFGSLYGLLTFVDRRIGLKDFIVFYDSETSQNVRMEIAEYRRLTQPRVLDFAYSTR